MPLKRSSKFELKPRGSKFVVVEQDRPSRAFSKHGMPRPQALRQMRALYASINQLPVRGGRMISGRRGVGVYGIAPLLAFMHRARGMQRERAVRERQGVQAAVFKRLARASIDRLANAALSARFPEQAARAAAVRDGLLQL